MYREWYGHASFQHPSPAPPEKLHELFPFYALDYTPVLYPPTSGETIDKLYERVAYALDRVIADLDADPAGPKSLLICTHAATLIALGRVLTGHVPADPEEQDFKPFTAGLSTFVRRRKEDISGIVGPGGGGRDIEDVVSGSGDKEQGRQGHVVDNTGLSVEKEEEHDTAPLPMKIDWRHGKGVQNGWDCVDNGNCSFLKGGEERGWYVLFFIFLFPFANLMSSSPPHYMPRTSPNSPEL